MSYLELIALLVVIIGGAGAIIYLVMEELDA